jgi:hypothetical protein
MSEQITQEITQEIIDKVLANRSKMKDKKIARSK